MRPARALLIASLALVALAAPAAAHSEDGTMTVTAATVEGATVHLEVGVLYTDEDLAEEAAVTAMLSGPGGASVGPARLHHVSGARYAADVELPVAGDWTATITSTGPKATATATFTATAAAPSTTTEPTTEPEITVPATRDQPASGGSSATPWVVGGIVAVVLAAGTALLLRRRR